jgi:DNA polymerase III alpha subunit
LPIPHEYSEERQIQEIAGFGFRCHPLELYRQTIKPRRPIAAPSLKQYIGQHVTLAGWLPEKMAETKHGESMEFLTFEDQMAMYDATPLPDAYRRYYHLLASENGYVVRGLVEESFGTVTVTITTLESLDTASRRFRRAVASSVTSVYRGGS